jgi:hypothetical protein
MPAIENVIYPSARAKFRTKIDMTGAVACGTYKTAFKGPFGLLEWLVMPQGLCNASCQRYLSRILREAIGTICAVFLDDIKIYSNSAEGNVLLIWQALRLHCPRISSNS